MEEEEGDEGDEEDAPRRAGTHSDRSKDPPSPFDWNGPQCPLLISRRAVLSASEGSRRAEEETGRGAGERERERDAFSGPQQNT